MEKQQARHAAMAAYIISFTPNNKGTNLLLVDCNQIRLWIRMWCFGSMAGAELWGVCMCALSSVNRK